ncbi:MAG: peptidoglycan-binding protein [Candidatus Pacebacteria bacterium]|nr:peptidoglycan-binding protein [Candidatus Paceibacterota bacterium]
MTVLRKSESAKYLAGIAILGMITFAFAFAIPQAQASSTVDVVCALVNCDAATRAALEAALGGSSTGASYTFTQDLTVGSTGEEVRQLQMFLNNNGYTVAASGAGSAGSESTYFGSLTAAALAKYQAANGIAPAVGYFGPITRASVNSMTSGSSDSSSSSSSTGLQGGAGSINDADYVSKLSNEKVGENEEDVEVAGLVLEADDNSDIELVAVNLNFSKGTANRDFDKYADEISVWFDGKEVARVDADEFEDDKNYDRTITLKSGAVIDAGDTGELVVAASGVSNLDSNDAGETWTLEFESVRFKDALGAVVTDSSTGDINDGSGRTFSFETFATAADVELKITDGDDSVNDARVIDVDDTQDTDGVELFSFYLEAKGDSDITIDDMPVTYTSVGTNVDDIVNTLELWIDGELVDSVTAPSSATTTTSVTFDNFDYTISAGDKVEAVIKGDINDIEAGTFDEGDTLSVAFGETETDDSAFDVEDEDGTDLVDADKTGSASAGAHSFYSTGIAVDLISTSTDVAVGTSSNDDSGTFTIKFKVTSVDGTIYIADSAGVSTNTSSAQPADIDGTDAVVYNVLKDGSATTSASATLTKSDAGDATRTSSNLNWQLDSGESQTFTLTVSHTNVDGGAGLYQAVLKAIGWNTDDDANDYRLYDFNLDGYETNPTTLN